MKENYQLSNKMNESLDYVREIIQDSLGKNQNPDRNTLASAIQDFRNIRNLFEENKYNTFYADQTLCFLTNHLKYLPLEK